MVIPLDIWELTMTDEVCIGLFSLGLLFINFIVIDFVTIGKDESRQRQIILWCVAIALMVLRTDFNTHLKLVRIEKKIDAISASLKEPEKDKDVRVHLQNIRP